MDEINAPEIEAPIVVKTAFENMIKLCQDAETFEEKKRLMESITLEENSKIYNIWFSQGEQNWGFSIVGNKKAINTYDVIDIRFIFIGPRGIAHKRLNLEERRAFLNAFKLQLLNNNFDINTYKFIPEL